MLRLFIRLFTLFGALLPKGIGPAYSSKIVRNGVRVGDLQYFEDFKLRFRALVEYAERAHGNALHVDVEKEIAYYESVRELVSIRESDEKTILFFSFFFFVGAGGG